MVRLDKLQPIVTQVVIRTEQPKLLVQHLRNTEHLNQEHINHQKHIQPEEAGANKKQT